MSQTTFPPDAVEEQIPDYRTAEQMLREHDPSFLRYVQQRRLSFEKHFGAEEFSDFLDKAQRTLVIAYARFALRHGNWSEDLHAYHNEGHALEILAGRINYLCEQAGAERLKPVDWVMLTLFAATHDLRQREVPDLEALVGNNERASISEAHRIMESVGFDRETDAAVFDDLELMIAGSTFNVQPKQNPNLSPPEAASSCGALAPMLVKELDQNNPHWPDDPELKRRVRLTLIASDLDTANVSEPILKFAQSAVRLCREIEFRCGRDMDSAESAPSVLGFLTRGQEAYFFELHQFDSILGNEILGPMKETNAPLLTVLCEHMRKAFGTSPEAGVTGRMILDEFMHKASEIAGRVAKT